MQPVKNTQGFGVRDLPGLIRLTDQTPVSTDFNPERRFRAVRAYSSGALAVK